MKLYDQALRQLYESGAVAHQMLADNHDKVSRFETFCSALMARGIRFHPHVVAEVDGPVFGISLMRHHAECADALMEILREMGAGLVHKGTAHRIANFRVSVGGVPDFMLAVHAGNAQPSAHREPAR